MSESVTCTLCCIISSIPEATHQCKTFKQCEICLVQRKVTNKIKQAVCNKSRQCLRGHCNHITFVWNTGLKIIFYFFFLTLSTVTCWDFFLDWIWLTVYLQHNDHSPEDIESSKGRRRLCIRLEDRVFEVLQPEAVTWKTQRHQSSSSLSVLDD